MNAEPVQSSGRYLLNYQGIRFILNLDNFKVKFFFIIIDAKIPNVFRNIICKWSMFVVHTKSL